MESSLPGCQSTNERTRRKAAYDLSDNDAMDMITVVSFNMIECNSFTSTSYSLFLEQSGPGEFTIVSYTCPDFLSLRIICKYMFLANPVQQIPLQTHALKYHPTVPIPPQQPVNSSNNNRDPQQLLSQVLD